MNRQTETDILMETYLKELHCAFVKEHRFDPERRWRLDFFLPDVACGIEIEGGLFIHGGHSRGKDYEDDLEKYNTATAYHNITILRFSPRMVKNGEAKRYIAQYLTIFDRKQK